MDFEAYRISENNWQLYQLDEHSREWLASFNSLNNLIIYYIHCHNLSNDRISFTGTDMNTKEKLFLDDEWKEWSIEII